MESNKKCHRCRKESSHVTRKEWIGHHSRCVPRTRCSKNCKAYPVLHCPQCCDSNCEHLICSSCDQDVDHLQGGMCPKCAN